MNSDDERFRRIQISRRIAQLNELYNLQLTDLEVDYVIRELEDDLLNLLRSLTNSGDRSNNQVGSDRPARSSSRSSDSTSDSEGGDSRSESDSSGSAESNVSTESDSGGEDLSDYSDDDNSSPESYSGSE